MGKECSIARETYARIFGPTKHDKVCLIRIIQNLSQTLFSYSMEKYYLLVIDFFSSYCLYKQLLDHVKQ